jgi:Rrf2 family protein
MSKIVTLSEAASIAIHAMVLIAKTEDVNINVNKISELTGASKNHIAKVMQRLVKEKFVKSTRGPSGGFVMDKNPSEITLLDVYQCIEGDISLSECPLSKQICPFTECLMNGIVHKLTNELIDFLKSKKLSDQM